MKEKIYTIPVNEAFDVQCECPICELETKTSSDLIAYYMGASLMEPDVRKVTNEKGFCREHMSCLYNSQTNRLGLGLMLHTHLSDVCNDINAKMLKLSAVQNQSRLFGKNGDFKKSLLQCAEAIENRSDSCALCERLEYTIDRYIDVILWLYFEDETFKKKFHNSKGFCLPHTAKLLRGSAKYLSSGQAAAFVKALTEFQNASMDNLRNEIEWFTKKFDYKNDDKPWGNSRDAVPRTIRKLEGKTDLKQ